MIDWIETGWLWTLASGPQTNFVDLTFELPDVPAMATCAISASSVGVWENTPGSVAVYVRETGVFTGPAAVKVIDIPPDAVNNSWYVEHGAWIRFRMTAFQAQAWAQASVFAYTNPKPVAPKAGIGWREKLAIVEYAVTDGSTGKRIGTHRIMKKRRGSVIPIDALVARTASEAAGPLGLRKKDLRVVRIRPTLVPPSVSERTVF